jgi:hypothetical protein
MCWLSRAATQLSVVCCFAATVAKAELAKPWYTTDIDDTYTELKIKTTGDDNFKLYDRSYALLIGEVNYTKWPRLTTIPGELASLTKALERQRFKVTTYFDLTSEAMIAAIDQFIRTRGATLNSRIVIYISAHGFTMDPNLTRVGYILPIDTPKEDSDPSEIAGKAVPMTMFAAWAQTPFPRHMFFFFDACFSGAFFGYQGSLRQIGQTPQTNWALSAEGLTLDKNGQIIYPPPERNGIESSSHIFDYGLLDGSSWLPATQSNPFQDAALWRAFWWIFLMTRTHERRTMQTTSPRVRRSEFGFQTTRKILRKRCSKISRRRAQSTGVCLSTWCTNRAILSSRGMILRTAPLSKRRKTWPHGRRH